MRTLAHGGWPAADRAFVLAMIAPFLMQLPLAGCDRPSTVPEDAPGVPGASMPAVSAERIREHMEFLADDRMQGRETGTEGYRQAAEYVAARFREWGLEPFGDSGGYDQEVEFLASRLLPETGKLALRRGAERLDLRFGEGFVTMGSHGEPDLSITAPLVFVGYGIQAPEFGHDDFGGVDVSGRILVRLTGAPPRFPTDQRAYYSSAAVKNAQAVAFGAVGVMTVRMPVDLPRLPWQRYLNAVGSRTMHWIGPDGAPYDAFPELAGEAVLSEAGAAALFAFAGRDLPALFAVHEAGQTGSFALGLVAAMERRSVQERIAAPNVVARIAGRDPTLQHEHLLYTAHLDHLGIRPGMAGDDIHNGAYDNAAGVAVILEVARVMAGAGQGPRRSVVFAALAGEESGLQGSACLAHRFPAPLEHLVANVNIDMPYLGFPVADVEGLGVEHSSLYAALARATALIGLELTPDPRPDLVRFIRSDQFSFVRRGVPGLNLKPGSRSSDPGVDGQAALAAYLRDHYHQASDDLSLPYDPVGAERFARVALALGLLVADADERPRWNDGDFFGEKFGAVTAAPPGPAVLRGERQTEVAD